MQEVITMREFSFRWLLILIMALLIGALALACSPCTSLFKGKNVGTGRVGAPLTVGDAKYTVSSASKQPYIQMGTTQRKPDGVYVVVDFQVENISKSTKKFNWRMVNLIDGQERTYAYKVVETSYLTNQLKLANPTLADVQPGTPVRFQIVFDVAIGATDLKLNVKDFAFIRAAEGQIDLGI